MKLVSCHIENFGKLHDYSVDFSEGLNNICEENGWGKTTFSAFLRAMFYGLEGERKRSIEENERKRYKPWQGGVFGGQLVFELQGKVYQISRIFGDKEAKDEFELRDMKTNLPSKDYSNKIGEEIFKINRESFLRTIFIGQNACETAATDDINAKIGNLVDNSNDLNNFDSAYAKLTGVLNALNPNRVTGSISQREVEIAKYERIVQDGQEISRALEERQGQLRSAEEKFEQLKEKRREAAEAQDKASKMQSAIAKKSEWERLNAAVNDRTQKADAIRQNFPGEIPNIEEIKKNIITCGDMDKSYDRVLFYQMKDGEREELSVLENAFAGGIPKEEEIDDKRQKANRLREIELEMSVKQMSATEEARLKELETYFGNETENVASVVEVWNVRNNKKATLASTQATLEALQASIFAPKQQTRNRKLPVLLVLGAAAILLGIFLAACVSPFALGIVAVGVGVVLLLVGMIGNKKESETTQTENSPEIEKLKGIVDEDNAFIADADARVAAYLKMHGKAFAENNASVMLQEITEESVEYSALKKKAQKANDRTKATEFDGLKREISAFLASYGIEDLSEERFSDDLYVLKSRVSGFLSLKEKKENFEKAESEYRKLHQEIMTFLEKYGYEMHGDLHKQLTDIQDCIMEYLNAVKEQKSAIADYRQFEENNDISELSEVQTDEEIPSLEAISQEIHQLTEDMDEAQRAISNYNQQMNALWEQQDKWEEACGLLEDLKKQQEAEQKRYKYIDIARTKLSVAKETMMAKYADPILEGFSQYYKMLSGKEADHFRVDANTKITVDEMGKQRDVNTLSYGYKDLIGICLRLAFVDAMYDGESPMLIMDDPFTNLDDCKIIAGKKFIEKIAEKYQIIYFTCSDSRSLLIPIATKENIKSKGRKISFLL